MEIDGIAYETDRFGVIHQDPSVQTQIYDRAYVEQRYDSLPDRGRQMSLLRAGFIVGVLGWFQTLLDVGYGNGDFLDVWHLWQSWRVQRWGLDVSGYPLPEGCSEAAVGDLAGNLSWDVATFFDSLEHIADLSFLASLRAKHIVVTVPWCHADQLGMEWFKTWKHRRPGEHLHHFNPHSLTGMMREYGYDFVTYQTIEDAIRQPANGHENTFTAVYRKV